MRHAPLAALAALALLGCGAADPIDRYVSWSPRIQELCRCPAAFAHSDEATCRAEIAEELDIPESVERCLRDVYAAHSGSLEVPLDCILDARDAYLACAEEALRVCPPSMEELRVCNEQLRADQDACPTPADAAASAFAGCLSM